jgi:hypothetical protein
LDGLIVKEMKAEELDRDEDLIEREAECDLED